MDIKPIKTRRDYQLATKEIESLMSAKARSAEGDRLDVLVTLVQAYEAQHFPLDLPDPVEAIKFAMGRRRRISSPTSGSRTELYEVLNRKRPLTLVMIWKLHSGLGIPAESLIRQAV